MEWRREDRYRERRKACLLLLTIVLFLVLVIIGIRQFTGSDPTASAHLREDTGLHGLPVAPGVMIRPEEQIVLRDADFYAKNDALSFYQYTESYYSEDKLVAEAEYDRTGSLCNLNWWEYDVAGNVYREHIGSETAQTRRYVYEYDDSGNVVHEEVYWDDNLAENNYFRYMDLGRAGISYSYIDEQYEGGLASYCRSRREFLEDGQGKLLCAFEIPVEIPYDVWKIQWTQKEDYLINRLLYYESRLSVAHNDSNWYLNRETADEEQFNLYAYHPDTGSMNHILQILYDWDYDTDTFVLLPSFYMAQYDGEHLMWQLTYESNRVQYYNVCQYDNDGRLQAAVEYVGNDDEPYALFHRYEYNNIPQEAERTEAHYFYEIKGREFIHQAEDGSNISFIFSDEGFLSRAEMTDMSGDILQKCEVVIAGKNFGKLEKLYIDGDMAEGIDAIMEQLEEKAESYGFQAGEDLEGSME